MQNEKIIVENKNFVLTINPDCTADSLVYKANNIECLDKSEKISLFALTEERPFNNEIKLAYPTKQTTFCANSVRREGNRLIIGFELVTFEAVVEILERDEYISFELSDFIVKPEDFGILCMTPPPVVSFRLLQLPIKNREHFGRWLNVMWDDEVAVAVVANSPHADVDSEKRTGFRILTADCLRDVKLRGTSVSLIVSGGKKILDSVDALERDFGLPRGVASRRNPVLNRSVYWVEDLTPQNVDMHINYAKMGGFSMMLAYYTSMCKFNVLYDMCGEYDYKDEYPNGVADLEAMLKKIKAAGITPGLHFLHTHIGIETKYVTPVADPRLNLTRHFTLAKDIGKDDNVIYVQQNPEGSVMHEKCRVLKFDGELINYTGYSTEYPYCFTGCTRGHYKTNVTEHNRGTIGGILDVSEFGATSVYLDQNSDLQDEIAEKLAGIYNAGFEFAYFDGSEGANPPFAFHVSNAQYRVYKRFDNEPLFCEGAAKTHFSWHMMSGGNAFDVFPTPKFKESIVKYPFDEAERMTEDFTRVNFGWWNFYPDTQPDIYEFGTSRAAAWDCPATMMSRPQTMEENARTKDTLEVMRRWEDVRQKNILTDEQKLMLRDHDQEHIMLIDENGEYELCPYNKIEGAAGGDERVRAFSFERKGRSYVIYWHTEGSGKFSLPTDSTNITVTDELGKSPLAIETYGEFSIIPIEGRRYISSTMSLHELEEVIRNGKLS